MNYESTLIKRKNCIIVLSLDVIAENWETLREFDRPGQDIVWGQEIEIPGSALIINTDMLFKDHEFSLPVIDVGVDKWKHQGIFGFPVTLDVFRPTVSVV